MRIPRTQFSHVMCYVNGKEGQQHKAPKEITKVTLNDSQIHLLFDLHNIYQSSQIDSFVREHFCRPFITQFILIFFPFQILIIIMKELS